MRELLASGVPIQIAAAANTAAGTDGDDQSPEAIIARQHEAIKLLTLILDDVRFHILKGEEINRIVQGAIEQAGNGNVLAERLERETWGFPDNPQQ